MKKLIFLSLVFTLTLTANSQRRMRIASVDMDYILEKMPEYQSALKELNLRAERWKNTIQRKEKEIKDLKDKLEQEKILLTKELLQEKQEEIAFKEKELLKYQLAKFGPEGDYILQKEHLVTPVQDRVFNAVAKLVQSAKYDIVFDKSNDKLGLIYTSPKLDISDKILKLINKERGKEEREKKAEKRKKEKKEKLSAAAKARKELAEKRKKEREAKRKAALEARKKQRETKKGELKKSVIKEKQKTNQGAENEKKEGENKQSKDNYGEQLTPEQLKEFQKKAPELNKEKLAEQRKKQREARRQKILEERRKKKNKQENKNKE